MQIYLFFPGTCEAAIAHYASALGAEVLHLTRYSEAPPFMRAPERDSLIFHSTLRIGESVFNMSDDPDGEKGTFGGFNLLVHLETADQVDATVAALAVEGSIDFAPQSTQWTEHYAVVTDRFGVTWKIQA